MRKWAIRILLVVALGVFLLLRLAGNLFEELIERSNTFVFEPDATYAQLLIEQLALDPAVDYTCADAALLAERAAALVPDEPLQRYQLTTHFYAADGLGYGAGFNYGYGQGQIDFTAWEYGRGVLAVDGGSAWWRAVNGALLTHMVEAHLLHQAGLSDCGGSSPAVDAWLAYVADPTGLGWYQAHNASIEAGYTAYESLARAEPLAERIVMANTLNRVTLADFMAAGQDLIGAVSDPGGPAVDWITAIGSFYPTSYPLDEKDAVNAALLYLIERNRITYAGVDLAAAQDYLLETGMAAAEIEKILSGDTDLYRELFPGYQPPEGPVQ